MANPPINENKADSSIFRKMAKLVHEHPYIFRTIMASAAAISGTFTGGLGAAAVGVAWVAIENVANSIVADAVKVNNDGGKVKNSDEDEVDRTAQDLESEMKISGRQGSIIFKQMQEKVEKEGKKYDQTTQNTTQNNDSHYFQDQVTKQQGQAEKNNSQSL